MAFASNGFKISDAAAKSEASDRQNDVAQKESRSDTSAKVQSRDRAHRGREMCGAALHPSQERPAPRLPYSLTAGLSDYLASSDLLPVFREGQ
jgi:hypothetical protein